MLMMKDSIQDSLREHITAALAKLSLSGKIVIERPADLANGDYSTNVALALAKSAGIPPRELAEKIVAQLQQLPQLEQVERMSVAGAGFINFFLSKDFYEKEIARILGDGKDFGKGEILSGKKVMVEYTQPNPFKPFHIGHLMSNAIGESISRVFANQGAEVIRANYQGDIGLHVAKALYGILKKGGAYPSGSVSEIADYIGECYVVGAHAYENDADAIEEIDSLNKRLYEKDGEIWPLYEEGRKITLDAFEELYKILGTKFDVYYFESDMAETGKQLVQEFLEKGVFENSDGAIVFHAEKFDPKLHTRVFLTSAGLAPYEAKELGLTVKKFADYDPDISIVDTATEQKDYMSVLIEAIRRMFPKEKYADRMIHITHGMMRFASGKMSSRKGNVVTGVSLIRDTVETILEKMKDRDLSEAEKKNVAEIIGVAAIKYSILRSKTGSDIVYDVEKSISTEGDSGPYLQYAITRAGSVLEKAKKENIAPDLGARHLSEVSNLEKLLVRYPEVVLRAWEEIEPHHVVTYLTELSSAFNSFYAKEKIVDAADPASSRRLALTLAFKTVMENGLDILGIRIPDKM